MSNGNIWWCPNCKHEVDGHQVTFQEHHDSCGTIVWSVSDDTRLSDDFKHGYYAGYKQAVKDGEPEYVQLKELVKKAIPSIILDEERCRFFNQIYGLGEASDWLERARKVGK